MRHGVSGRKLGRTASHRGAMFKNMASSLVQNGRICTTIFKAKEIKKYADKLVTLGKQNTLHAKRLAYARLGNNNQARQAVDKLFNIIAPAFAGRSGGYTRIYRIGTRRGDGSELAYVEYLNEVLVGKTKDDSAEGSKKPAAKKAKVAKEPKVKKEPKAKKAPAKKESAKKEKP